MAPDFVLTGNAEAVDLICRRYSVGSPTEYLRRARSLSEVMIDYAMARRYRDREVENFTSIFNEKVARLGHNKTVEQIGVIALECLLLVTSSKS